LYTPEEKRALPLVLQGILRTDRGVPSGLNRRVRVHRTLAEYLGLDGQVYRKAFEAQGKDPEVPDHGTHAEMDAKKKQW